MKRSERVKKEWVHIFAKAENGESLEGWVFNPKLFVDGKEIKILRRKK